MKNNISRRTRERRETRLRIIDAARELFSVGGEEGLTLRKVAERIEYSATTIYLHFQNKDALVQELCATDFAAFSRRLIQADRVSDPLDRLKKVSAAYIDFGLQYPGHYRAMFISTRHPAATPGVKPVPEGIEERVENESGPYNFLQGAVFKALAAGVFKTEYSDVSLVTQTLWGGLHGVVSLHQARAKHPSLQWRPIQTLAETMIECLLNGMTLPSQPTGPDRRRGG